MTRYAYNQRPLKQSGEVEKLEKIVKHVSVYICYKTMFKGRIGIRVRGGVGKLFKS